MYFNPTYSKKSTVNPLMFGRTLVTPTRVELAVTHPVLWQGVRESNSCQRIESPFAEPAPRHAPQIWQPARELNPYRRLERAPSSPLEEQAISEPGAADRIRTGICSIDNRELSPLSYGCAFGTASDRTTLMRAMSEHLPHAMVGVEGFEPSMLRRAPGLRPGRATSRPNTPNNWRRGRESNAQVPKKRPASNGIGLPHAEPLHQFLAVAARVERASPEGTSRLERNGLSKCPTLPSTPSDEDLSQETPDRGGRSRT